jgi:hypothetical protein
MTVDVVTETPRRELSLPKNTRYIGYNLLQNVRWAGEPVVPKILREVQDEPMPYFEVESLPGTDLAQFLGSEVSMKTKLLVVREVVRQLQEIDRSGFVLFDRKEDNIRVCNGDPDNISVRQTDLEDIYDKKFDAVYSFDNQARYEQMVDDLNSKGIDLWSPTVMKLSYAVLGLKGLPDDVRKKVEPFKKIKTMPAKQDTLQQFEGVINGAIQQ